MNVPLPKNLIVLLFFAGYCWFHESFCHRTSRNAGQALNATLVARFDTIVKKHRLENKTIGDAYMAAYGLPERSDDHVERGRPFCIGNTGCMKEAPPNKR